MGKIVCRGRMCKDEETGAIFFLPDPECNPDDFVKLNDDARITGISMVNPKVIPKKEKKE